jgi:hypothetical protein
MTYTCDNYMLIELWMLLVIVYMSSGGELSILHDVFHVSQLRKYVYDASHVIQVDELEVRDNLTVETWPVRIEDREVKHLRGKEIVLVKVIWVGPTGESAT